MLLLALCNQFHLVWSFLPSVCLTLIIVYMYCVAIYDNTVMFQGSYRSLTLVDSVIPDFSNTTQIMPRWTGTPRIWVIGHLLQKLLLSTQTDTETHRTDCSTWHTAVRGCLLMKECGWFIAWLYCTCCTVYYVSRHFLSMATGCDREYYTLAVAKLL